MRYSRMNGGILMNAETGSPKAPLVSCIVICYKKFEYLFDAIRSVLIQNYPRIELLVSDDASPDFERYREKITRFVQQNAGVPRETIFSRWPETMYFTMNRFFNGLLTAFWRPEQTFFHAAVCGATRTSFPSASFPVGKI